MKLYGLGGINDWDCYAIVMANNEEEAWEKAMTEAINDTDSYEICKAWKEGNVIEELPSGVWFGENA